MNRLGLGLASIALVALSACGGGSGGGGNEKVAAKPTPKELGNVSSVIELRDALVSAGYDCSGWEQDNVVDLAAESGHCGDDDVLTTYASEDDRQAQLDTDKGMNDMFQKAGVEQDPTLVGPNWMFRGPDAGDYADELGGTVVRPAD